MKTRTKVTTATLALGALALSGGTLALWSDTVTTPDANISSGHLDLKVDALTAYDVSTLQVPKGTGETAADWTVSNGTPTAITNLANFRFVPEDVVRVAVPITVDLEGNNLLAKLDVNLATIAADHGFAVTNVGIVKGTDAVTAVKAAATTTQETMLFTQDTGTLDSAADQKAFAVYEITFTDTDTNGITTSPADNMDYALTDVLKATDVKLTQVRSIPTP